MPSPLKSYNNQIAMEKPLTYNKICIQTRKKLVQIVLQQKISIAKASRILGIKSSTGKLIVKRYRQTGTFFQSKSQLNLQNSGYNESGPASIQHPQIKQNSQGKQIQEVVKQQTGENLIFFFYPSAIDIHFDFQLYRLGQATPNNMGMLYWG